MAKKDNTSSQSSDLDEVIEQISNEEEIKKAKGKNHSSPLLLKKIKNPLWMSVSEAAKVGGVQTKTIRRAIKSSQISYKVIGNRYLVNLDSLVHFLYTKTKLKNKLKEFGIGQYIKEWER
jgi:excisionase family DNA binding protein